MMRFGINTTLTSAHCTHSAIDTVEHMVYDVTHCSHSPFTLTHADQTPSAISKEDNIIISIY